METDLRAGFAKFNFSLAEPDAAVHDYPMNKLIWLRLLGCTALFGLIGFTGCSSSPRPEINWALTGTVWKVVEINGEMVGAKTIPTLQLETGGQRVIGFGGINQISGTYKLDGTALSFGPFISTRMAGLEAQMKVEADFLKVLATVTKYQTKGPWLALLAGDKIVAHAQATPAVAFPSR